MLEAKKILHYFISTVNVIENLLPHDDRTQLDVVATTIKDMMNHKKFPGHYIYDRMAHHNMAFNPKGHKMVVESRTDMETLFIEE